MILLFRIPTTDASGSSSEIRAKTRSSSSENAKRDETVFEVVLNEMKRKGFEVNSFLH